MEPEEIPVKKFEEFLSNYFPEERDDNWLPLLKNSFTHNLKLHLNSSNRNEFLDLAAILIQFRITILKSNASLLRPLARLILEPAQMTNAFFPTMEHDTLIEIKNSLVKGNSQHKDPNVKFYLCPNGHMYILFDVNILVNRIVNFFILIKMF